MLLQIIRQIQALDKGFYEIHIIDCHSHIFIQHNISQIKVEITIVNYFLYSRFLNKTLFNMNGTTQFKVITFYKSQIFGTQILI